MGLNIDIIRNANAKFLKSFDEILELKQKNEEKINKKKAKIEALMDRFSFVPATLETIKDEVRRMEHFNKLSKIRIIKITCKLGNL